MCIVLTKKKNVIIIFLIPIKIIGIKIVGNKFVGIDLGEEIITSILVLSWQREVFR